MSIRFVIGLCMENFFLLLILTLSHLQSYRLTQYYVQEFIVILGIGVVFGVELERFLNWWLLLSQLWYLVQFILYLRLSPLSKELSLFRLSFKITFGFCVLMVKFKEELIFVFWVTSYHQARQAFHLYLKIIPLFCHIDGFIHKIVLRQLVWFRGLQLKFFLLQVFQLIHYAKGTRVNLCFVVL